MNTLNAFASQLSLKKKKAVIPMPNPIPSMLDDEREEDGFTLVGQSWSERNTVYPQNKWTVPPPSYQVSCVPHVSCSLPCYKDVSRCWSVTHATNEQLQQMPSPNRLVIQNPNTEHRQPHINSSSNHPFLQDVPFTLSPRIDPFTEATFFVECRPCLDLSELTYDFCVEQQIASQALEETNNTEDVNCDNGTQLMNEFGAEAEDQLIQRYGQEAVVAQDMFDLIGMDSTGGNQCLGTQQDLMSF